MKISLIHGSPIKGINKFNPRFANPNNLTSGISGGIFGTYFYWSTEYAALEIFKSNVVKHAKNGSIYKCEFDINRNKPLLNDNNQCDPDMIANILLGLFPDSGEAVINNAIDKIDSLKYTNFQAFNWLSIISRDMSGDTNGEQNILLSKFIEFASKETPGILLGNIYGTAIFFDPTKIEIIEEIEQSK